MAHVLGVYCSDDKVCKIKVQTTGKSALFLNEADTKPGQHVWARYGNLWYHFHVLKEFENQKGACDEEMEFCELVVSEKEKQQNGQKKTRLVCCAIANLEHDLPLPTVPNELRGKTQFPDIVASPEYIIEPNLEQEEFEPPARKKRKLHPVAKAAPKRILEKYNIKQKPVHANPSNKTNEVLLRELITVVYGLQNQMKAMDAKLNVLDERTNDWTGTMNELKRRHKNCKKWLKKKNKNGGEIQLLGPLASPTIVSGSTVSPAPPIIVSGPLDHATVSLAPPIIVSGPLDHATVSLAPPIIVSGSFDHATVSPAPPIIVSGPLDHVTVSPAPPIIVSRPFDHATMSPAPRIVPDSVPSTSVVVDMSISSPSTIQFRENFAISPSPHSSSPMLERNTVTSTPVTPKDLFCRFFRKNGTTFGIRTTVPRVRAAKMREQLIAQSTLYGDKLSFVGPIKVPTIAYTGAKRQQSVSAYFRKLAPFFFSPLEMANSSIFGGKAPGGTGGPPKEYLPIAPVRLSLLFDIAEKDFPNRFLKSTALIPNYNERSKAPLCETTSAALQALAKFFHEYKQIDITQVEHEFGKEFGPDFSTGILSAADENFKLINTAEKNCEEIVGLNHIRIR